MSLNEVHADVQEHDEDQPAMDSRVSRWRSMMTKQSIESGSVNMRGASSLPDATGGTVVADKADSTNDALPYRNPGQ